MIKLQCKEFLSLVKKTLKRLKMSIYVGIFDKKIIPKRIA